MAEYKLSRTSAHTHTHTKNCKLPSVVGRADVIHLYHKNILKTEGTDYQEISICYVRTLVN